MLIIISISILFVKGATIAMTEEKTLKEIGKIGKYKVLVFDLDDTLIDNLENVRHAFKKMIEQQKEIYDDEKFKRWYDIDKKFWENWQDGLIELPEHLKSETGKKSEEFLNWVRGQRVLIYFNNEISLEEVIDLNYVYMKALTEIVVPVEGAFETLEYLASTKKYYILVATNGPKTATNEKLSKINCLNFVKDVLSADMFGYMKPKKEFFEEIQQKLDNYNNDEFLIIGDSLKSDVGFGMACGFDSCWFDRKNKKLTENYKPTFTIEKLVDLKNIL